MTRRIHEILLDDPAVDMLVVGQPTSHFSDESAADLIGLARRTTKPVIALWTGRHAIAGALARLRAARVPVFEQADLCYRALRAVFWQAEFRRPRSRSAPGPLRDPDQARRAAAVLMCQAAPDGLSEHESKTLLGMYGIAAPPERVVRSDREAIEAADQLGYPVALKAHGRALRHKTELGGVRLDLNDREAVVRAYRDVTRTSGSADALVATMISAGPELLLGLVRDPQVGLLLVVGLGGVLAEVLDDVVVAVPPLWPGEAEALLGQLRRGFVLDGLRGRPACDRRHVVAALERLSDLSDEIGDLIDQIDVNPLIALPGGAWAADALVIPRRTDSLDSDALHRELGT